MGSGGSETEAANDHPNRITTRRCAPPSPAGLSAVPRGVSAAAAGRLPPGRAPRRPSIRVRALRAAGLGHGTRAEALGPERA